MIFINRCPVPQANDNSGLDRTCNIFSEVFRGMEMVDKILAAPRAMGTTIHWSLSTVRMTVKE
jgi:cyclophilin family peptidyl-prolyl cis-trans isomerase